MIDTDKHVMDRFFSGTADDKMAVMEGLYKRHGERLRADAAIISSLSLLKRYAGQLSAHMDDMGMGGLCGKCAARANGGCCSSYMEANSDVILLLMNRMHGTVVSRQHDNGEECCFLGDTGCILSIKPMFCLNYNCTHIHAMADKEEIARLEQLAGRILTEQTGLETILLQNL